MTAVGRILSCAQGHLPFLNRLGDLRCGWVDELFSCIQFWQGMAARIRIGISMKRPVSHAFLIAEVVMTPFRFTLAQSPSHDSEQICLAIERALVLGEQTSGALQGGLKWQFTRENGFVVTRPSAGSVAQNPFSFSNHEQCVAQVTTLIEQRACTVTVAPARSFDVTRTSPEMSGGHTQPEWCSQVIGQLRGEYSAGTFSVLSSSETSRSGCAPFNCPLYTYHCTVHVDVGAITRAGACPQ